MTKAENLGREGTTRTLQEMSDAAREAGEFQAGEFRKNRPGWGDEKAAKDFVSYVDLRSEAMIRARLEPLFPGAAFYGEETSKDRGELHTWIVDPLDGTTNYLSGYDHWSVSIALAEKEAPVLGIVFKPSTGELLYAAKGSGAFRNGERLPKAERLDPGGALVATGTPYRSPDLKASYFRAADRIMEKVRDLRRTGSAALDLAYLASGFFQGFWETDLKPYDVAAALLLLDETGCPYTEFSGAPYRLFESRTLVAGFPGVYEALQKLVEEEYPSRACPPRQG